MIGERGGIAGDFTVTCLGEDDDAMIGSGMAERYHKRDFDAVPLPARTSWASVTEAKAGVNVAGPKVRELLMQLTSGDLSNAAVPFMRAARIEVAGVKCVALRVSFTGECGWEPHCDEADQARLSESLLEVGKGWARGRLAVEP